MQKILLSTFNKIISFALRWKYFSILENEKAGLSDSFYSDLVPNANLESNNLYYPTINDPYSSSILLAKIFYGIIPLKDLVSISSVILEGEKSKLVLATSSRMRAFLYLQSNNISLPIVLCPLSFIDGLLDRARYKLLIALSRIREVASDNLIRIVSDIIALNNAQEVSLRYKEGAISIYKQSEGNKSWLPISAPLDCLISDLFQEVVSNGAIRSRYDSTYITIYPSSSESVVCRKSVNRYEILR